MSQRARPKAHIEPRLVEAAEAIDQGGVPGQGSCKEAEYDAVSHTTPGYYPHESTHLIGVDLADEQWLHSMTIAVNYELAQHGLLTNSFWTDRFTGYRNDIDPIEHDYIFHVVDLTWLPEEWI